MANNSIKDEENSKDEARLNISIKGNYIFLTTTFSNS
jgi:hypothetical protein